MFLFDIPIKWRYNKAMEIDFDPRKNASNFAKHGLRFEDVAALEWETAFFAKDEKRLYGEDRIVAYVLQGGRLYVVCLTLRAGGVIRIFSFRKANKRERSYYDQETLNR